ncbi:hypothetical protein ACOMHN_001776 [Nucella lapillus]
METQMRSQEDLTENETVRPAPHTLTNRNIEHNARDDCIQVIFSDMKYIPWDNPDNLVSAEVETIIHRVQDNLLVLLFLIGGPANVINMAVFYKQGLKDRVNLCLFALSLSDGLFLTGFTILYIEQLYTQFTTKEKYSNTTVELFDHNFMCFAAFGYISAVLSAVIATERCLCVYFPLKFQHLLRTKTVAIFISVLYVLVFSLVFMVVFRYRIKCLHDPTSGAVVMTFIEGEFYKANQEFIEYIDSIIFGAGIPGTVMTVVIFATALTIVKLRQAATWRSDTSGSTISPQEIALTKMLVVNSILFVVCFAPDAVNHLSRFFVREMRSGGRYHNFNLTALWISDIFTFFNATFNIFVYYTMGSRYRETLWSLFGRKVITRKT